MTHRAGCPYEEQLHTLDKVLESLKNETIILLGGFNASNKVWDKHSKQNAKLAAILEDIIQQHSPYIALTLPCQSSIANPAAIL